MGALEGNTFQVCTTSEYRRWAFTFPQESAIGYALLWEVENSQARIAQITGDTALASSGNSLHVAGVSHEQYSRQRLWAEHVGEAPTVFATPISVGSCRRAIKKERAPRALLLKVWSSDQQHLVQRGTTLKELVRNVESQASLTT